MYRSFRILIVIACGDYKEKIGAFARSVPDELH